MKTNQSKATKHQEAKFLCKTCKKNPIEVYQLDKEVCFECWQAECFLSFVDEVATPTYHKQ